MIPIFDLILLVSSPHPDILSVAELFADTLTDIANDKPVLNEQRVSPAECQALNIIGAKQIKQLLHGVFDEWITGGRIPRLRIVAARTTMGTARCLKCDPAADSICDIWCCYLNIVHLFHILSCHHSHPYLIYLLLLTIRRSAKDKQHQPNTSCCP